MHEELYSMRKELAAILHGNRLLRSAVNEVNKIDMVKAPLIIRSPNHERIAIDRILEGELQKDVPVKDYVFIENMGNLVRVAQNCLEMDTYIDRHFLISAYRILSEDENGYFRKSNPVVYAFNHVPVHNLDIEDKLNDAVRRLYSRETGNNVILKAMYIHNKIIDIYPFENYSGEIAVFALNYYLMENGFTPISMPMKRDEYFNIVGQCLKGQRQEEFYNFLTKAVFEKMEGTLDACREYIKA